MLLPTEAESIHIALVAWVIYTMRDGEKSLWMIKLSFYKRENQNSQATSQERCNFTKE